MGVEGSDRAGAAVLVLSAGASSRSGNRPKPLARIDGEPAVARIVRLAGEAGVARVVVVVGAGAEAVRAALAGGPAEVVENPSWADGRTGSVQRGLAALPASDPIVLWPVDRPFVEAKTVRGLVDASVADPVGAWFVPTFGGRAGHPVLLRRSAVPRVRALARSEPLRAVLPALGDRLRRVPVDDPGILDNVDTPEAFAAAEAAWRGRRGSGWTGN